MMMLAVGCRGKPGSRQSQAEEMHFVGCFSDASGRPLLV